MSKNDGSCVVGFGFVECEVDLRKDGSAYVLYTVQWKVLSGVKSPSAARMWR